MQAVHEDTEITPGFDRKLIAQILGYVSPYRSAVAVCLILMVIEAGLNLAGPYLIKWGIDEVMIGGRRGQSFLVWLAAGYLLTAAGAAVIEYVGLYRLRVTGQHIIADIRNDVFAHLQTLGLDYFDRHPAGRLVTRVTNDVEALNDMYTTVLVTLFKDCFAIVGAAYVMWLLDTRLALVCYAVTPLVVLVAFAFQRLARVALRTVRTKLALINATLAENLSGVRVIQVFARERLQFEEFMRINNDYYVANMRHLSIYSVFRPLLEFVTGLALVALVWYGGHGVLMGTLSLGTLYAFTNYTGKLFTPVHALAEKFNILQSALASAERIFELRTTRPNVRDPERPSLPIAGAPAIEFEDVWFAYANEDWVLKGISFQVQPDEWVAVVGHTGAGKSTIMALISRFYDVQRGVVRVDGVDVREWRQADLRRRVGVVMQDVFLFAGDIQTNISLGDPTIGAERVIEACEKLSADGFIRRLPQGYETVLGERGMTLSAGQRQLISFARTLVASPAVLILDEATASIDSETETVVQAALRTLVKGRTIVTVAHRLSTVQEADRILVLQRGCLREAGSHQTLLAAKGLYYQLWSMQATGTGPLSRS